VGELEVSGEKAAGKHVFLGHIPVIHIFMRKSSCFDESAVFFDESGI